MKRLARARAPLVAGLLAATLAGCGPHRPRRSARAVAGHAYTASAAAEAEATRAADATVAAWTSMDAARIKALYTPDIVGFGLSAGELQTDRKTWDRTQEAYVSGRIDQAVTRERRLQLLDADTFVMSGSWNLKSSTLPANEGAIRCTDVFRRQPEGGWKIVNEHCSGEPNSF